MTQNANTATTIIKASTYYFRDGNAYIEDQDGKEFYIGKIAYYTDGKYTDK